MPRGAGGEEEERCACEEKVHGPACKAGNGSLAHPGNSGFSVQAYG